LGLDKFAKAQMCVIFYLSASYAFRMRGAF
jgi:hypothetical protein